MDVRLL